MYHACMCTICMYRVCLVSEEVRDWDPLELDLGMIVRHCLESGAMLRATSTVYN